MGAKELVLTAAERPIGEARQWLIDLVSFEPKASYDLLGRAATRAQGGSDFANRLQEERLITEFDIQLKDLQRARENIDRAGVDKDKSKDEELLRFSAAAAYLALQRSVAGSVRRPSEVGQILDKLDQLTSEYYKSIPLEPEVMEAIHQLPYVSQSGQSSDNLT